MIKNTKFRHSPKEQEKKWHSENYEEEDGIYK